MRFKKVCIKKIFYTSTYIFKEHAKIVKICMVKINVAIVNRLN